jgi:hypothetical protein
MWTTAVVAQAGPEQGEGDVMQRVLALGVLTASLLMVGCGRTPMTPPPLQPIVGQPTSPTYDPYPTSPYPAYGNTPYDPNSGNVPTVPLMAKIDSQKNGVFLGMGTFIVNVSVSNPATTEQTGLLRVSILDSGDSIRDFTETVRVPAGQTITRTYSDKRWKADSAKVSISPTPNSDPYNGGTQGGYNNPSSGYGSTGGGYGGYPSSSSGGYPSSGSGYPSSSGGYPSSGGSYPSYGSGYPSSSGGYPTSSGGYPTSSGGYPSSGSGYPSTGSYASYPANGTQTRK